MARRPGGNCFGGKIMCPWEKIYRDDTEDGILGKEEGAPQDRMSFSVITKACVVACLSLDHEC